MECFGLIIIGKIFFLQTNSFLAISKHLEGIWKPKNEEK